MAERSRANGDAPLDAGFVQDVLERVFATIGVLRPGGAVVQAL